MTTLTTKNLILSFPNSDDLLAINDFEIRNNTHLKKWESTSSVDASERLETWIRECEEGKSARFFIRAIEDLSKIIGFCNFTQIVRGPFQACYLGYKIDYAYEGKGLMFEALEASIDCVFKNLNLHRIMANYMPINSRSAKVLDRLGFTIEGYAKNYLSINGQWEDHVLTALSAEQWFDAQNKDNLEINLDNIIYREVQVADAPTLEDLMEQLGYPIDAKILHANIKKYMQLPNQKVFVAEKAGQVVGCVAVAITHYFHRQGSFLKVIAMIVDEQQRRSGIGKQLMHLAEKYAQDSGCSHIELTSGMHRGALGSHEFYSSLGYTEMNSIKKHFAKKLSITNP